MSSNSSATLSINLAKTARSATGCGRWHSHEKHIFGFTPGITDGPCPSAVRKRCSTDVGDNHPQVAPARPPSASPATNQKASCGPFVRDVLAGETPFTITCQHSLSDVASAMDQRFDGLPVFHRSVDLEMVENRRLLHDVHGDLIPSDAHVDMASPRLRPALRELIEYVNQAGGVKSLRLLRLKVRLAPELATKHFAGFTGNHSWLLRRFVNQIGRGVRVPVSLMVASSLRKSSYQSVAVGVRGVTRYKSALIIRQTGRSNVLEISGGLLASVNAQHVDHAARHLVPLVGLPNDLFDRYVQNHVYAERREILQRLLAHVFESLPPQE